MLTEIISNITAQNGYATFIWFVIQAIFFLIIFLLPLRLHDQKKDMEWEFAQQKKYLEHEINELKALIKEQSTETVRTTKE